MFPDSQRHGRSSAAEDSDGGPSPSPPEVILAPRRLDEAFVTFLMTYLSSPAADPRLARHVASRDILNPFASGDRLERVTRLFVDEAATIRPWIPEGSPLRERLRDYPGIYRHLWPAAAEEAVSDMERVRNSGVGKRRRDEERGDVGETKRGGGMDGAEEREGGGPGPETAKRRRVGGGSGSEFDNLFDSPRGSAAEGNVPWSGGQVPYSARDFAVGQPSRRYTGADPVHQRSGGDGEPTATGPSNIPLTIPVDAPVRREEEEGESEETIYTPNSSPPPSVPEHEPPFIAEAAPSQTAPPATITASTSALPPTPIPRSVAVWTLNDHSNPFDVTPYPLPPHPLPSPPPRIIPDYSPPRPPPETVDPDEHQRGVTRLDRQGPEWTENMVYHGTLQPPLCVRLEQMLNFLREEDVDRCQHWEREVAEVEEWLRWLDNEGPGGLKDTAGMLALNMIEDVRRKVRGHRLFEGEKYGRVGPGQGIQKEGDVPLPKKGRRPVVARGARGIELGEQVEDEGGRRVLVAKPERVNTQFHPVDSVDDDEAGEVDFFLKRLNESEKVFWIADPESDGTGEYLFRLENAAYEACSAPAGPLKGFKTKDGRGRLVLPNEEELPPPPEEGGEQSELDTRLRRYAVERGARRAALQEALRCFTNTEQTLATTEWNRVVPAVEKRVLDEVRRDLDRNYQWQPAQLDRGIAPVQPDKLETMPYTSMWRLHRKLLADLAEHARDTVNKKNASTPGWVTVPKGVIYGGPFVWRMIDPELQEQQDFLRECEAVIKAVIYTPHTTSETGEDSVLGGVKRYALDGAQGGYGISGSQQFPEELELALRGQERTSPPGRLVESVAREELKWLGFLTSKSVNEDMLKVTEESQPKLYSIFAARLEKAVDDRSKATLFREPDHWRTIEELLAVINRGDDESGKRVQFSPFQARYFLERAQEQGLCRYKNDHVVYGRVARSIRDIEPLQRVKVNVTRRDRDGNRSRAPLYPEDIRSFHQLPAASAAARLLNKNFFLDLGLRLGLTVFRLHRAKREWKNAKALSHTHLRDALNTFARVYRDVKEEHGLQWDSSSAEPGLSLAKFVKNIEPAAWQRHIRTVPASIPAGEWTAEKEDAAMEATALGFIRHMIIRENHQNLNMLGRGREVMFKKPDGNDGSAWVRDHNWDWASVEVRGKTKQFFSLDRWPLELQNEVTRGKIQRDEFIDPKMAFDPVAEDPIPGEYFRARLRRYGEDERLRHRPGPAIYPIGDTPLQRRMVRGVLIDKVARATGVNRPEKPQTWKQTLADMLPSRRSPTPDDDDMAETSLPEVDPTLIPESWTPPATSHVGHPAGVEAHMEDQDDIVQPVGDGNGSVEEEDDARMEEG